MIQNFLCHSIFLNLYPICTMAHIYPIHCMAMLLHATASPFIHSLLRFWYRHTFNTSLKYTCINFFWKCSILMYHHIKYQKWFWKGLRTTEILLKFTLFCGFKRVRISKENFSPSLTYIYKYIFWKKFSFFLYLIQKCFDLKKAP